MVEFTMLPVTNHWLTTLTTTDTVIHVIGLLVIGGMVIRQLQSQVFWMNKPNGGMVLKKQV